MIYSRLSPGAPYLHSDIRHPGSSRADSLIWNRALKQIEAISDPDARAFWQRHYESDFPGYPTRTDLQAALTVAGFEDIDGEES